MKGRSECCVRRMVKGKWNEANEDIDEPTEAIKKEKKFVGSEKEMN